MDKPAKQIVLEVDGRKRISLGNLATSDRYIVYPEDDGTLVLVPAVVVVLPRLPQPQKESQT